jgi:hypothetical protein
MSTRGRVAAILLLVAVTLNSCCCLATDWRGMVCAIRCNLETSDLNLYRMCVESCMRH